jgi:hypothetical protein
VELVRTPIPFKRRPALVEDATLLLAQLHRRYPPNARAAPLPSSLRLWLGGRSGARRAAWASSR